VVGISTNVGVGVATRQACAWGGYGCAEVNARGPVLAREFARRAGRGRLEAWFGVSAAEVTGEHIVRFLASKEADRHPFAEGAIDRAGGLLSFALGGHANALDPAVIVLGGRITEASMAGSSTRCARAWSRWPCHRSAASASSRLTGVTQHAASKAAATSAASARTSSEPDPRTMALAQSGSARGLLQRLIRRG
jgi:predicted NBD/HSP70 family sugar kinase